MTNTTTQPHTATSSPRYHTLRELSGFPTELRDRMIQLSPELAGAIEIGTLFPSSIAYLLYWYERSKKHMDKRNKVRSNFNAYLRSAGVSHITPLTEGNRLKAAGILSYGSDGSWNKTVNILDKLTRDIKFIEGCVDYVSNHMRPRKMVDLFITHGEKYQDMPNQTSLEFAVFQRDNFPQGKALPGGIILDSDEQNSYGFPSEIYATLRTGAIKVLKISEEDAIFYFDSEKSCYVVCTRDKSQGLTLSTRDISGFRHVDSLSKIVEPSNPINLVDTIGYRLEYFGELPGIEFIHVDNVKNIGQGSLVLEHHRKLIWGLAAKTESKLLIDQDHHLFIRDLIQKPEEMYQKLHDRFREADYASDTAIPEFLPVVRYIESELYTDRINMLCMDNPALIGMRDLCQNRLAHTHLDGRPLCPYLATVIAIENAIEFFDIVTRMETGYYKNSKIPNNKPIIHDPSEIPNARYHSYKYHYRFSDYFHNRKFHREIMIPTFVHVGATDLMRMRGVPLRIVGLSTDRLFVDEFDQTPVEFWAHDLNHCRRYALEDMRVADTLGISLDELYDRSSREVREYMPRIIIDPSDTPDEKAIKRIKKIILFEIVHEDARVFLKDTIVHTLLRMEGEDVPFEWRSQDTENRRGAVVDIQEKYIHTLSYVRYKLQKGFYDTFDDKKGYIADVDYRSSRKIAQIAHEIFVDLGIKVDREKYPQVEIGSDGYPTMDWLMHRIWSYGPPEVHNQEFYDPDKEKYHGGDTAATTREYKV